MTAHAVALRQLGYSIPEHDAGVTIYVIDPGSRHGARCRWATSSHPSMRNPTTNPQALVGAVPPPSGGVVRLQVGSIANPTPGHTVSVRLSSTVENHQKVPFLGIGDPRTSIAGHGHATRLRLPVPRQHQQRRHRRPLGEWRGPWASHQHRERRAPDRWTDDRRHRDHRPDEGSVGDVGGVEAKKTVAVEQASATIFFVPQELKVAKSMAARFRSPCTRSPRCARRSRTCSAGGRPRSGNGRPPPVQAATACHRLRRDYSLELTPGPDTHRPTRPRR